MKKLTILFAVALLMAITVVPAMAGPSRALIQEMGSVIAKDEVNVDLDVVPHTFDVAGADDTTLGAGNATVGGTTVSSVNVSLIDNLELRIGRLPGFRSYLTLPNALGVAGNNYGLTLKGAIPNVPGLAAWVGYGTVSEEDVAVLYPVRPTLLVGAELHYASIDTTDGALGDVELTALAPALGARAVTGNWTIDAVVALLGTSIDTDINGTDPATSTVIGVPTLRVNYKF